jgi:biotin carboxyl carrier protein
MQYEIEIGGRMRQVVVTRTGDAFSVSVDRRNWRVNAVRIDAYTMSLLIDPEVRPNGHQQVRLKPDTTYESPTAVVSAFSRTTIPGSHEITIAPDPATHQLTVRVGTTPTAVALNGRRRWGRKDDGAHAAAGPQRIVAPMPGKVVRVLVKAGDPVRARQGLVVIEAMKMENELRATRDGTVTDVQAREAMSVEAGAVLVVIA